MHEHESSMVNTGLEPTLYASQKPGLTIQLQIMNSQLIIITLYNMTDAEMEEVLLYMLTLYTVLLSLVIIHVISLTLSVTMNFYVHCADLVLMF